MGDPDNAGAMSFIHETGMLKRAKRAGWWIAGISDPESVADHSFRTAVIGAVLATMEGADAGRVALLCLLHDSQESRTGDVTHIGRRYVQTRDNLTITKDQVASCPPPVAETIRSAVAEYEAQRTAEAVVAHDADKLECLVQAVEYRAQGCMTVQPWIDTSLAALQTESAKHLAEAALTGNPIGWLNTFMERS